MLKLENFKADLDNCTVLICCHTPASAKIAADAHAMQCIVLLTEEIRLIGDKELTKQSMILLKKR